jgi:hypothetical protein
MSENKMFDENKAIQYIRDYMPAEIAGKYADDEILNIIDMIWDFYEDNGFLEIDVDNDSEPDLSQIIEYVNRMLAKDKLAQVERDDVHYIVEGEIEYENSLEADI